MLAAPSIYDPRLNPDLARIRRDHALDRMVEADYLSAARAAGAKGDPVLTAGAAHSPDCA
jgi:membrane peptidoglycan carboxypeptidase